MTETANSDGGEIAVPGLHRHPRRKCKPLSPERRAKISTALTGKPKSPEHRAKLSASKSGEKHPFFGKSLSLGHREKLTVAARKREARKRIPIELPSASTSSAPATTPIPGHLLSCV